MKPPDNFAIFQSYDSRDTGLGLAPIWPKYGKYAFYYFKPCNESPLDITTYINSLQVQSFHNVWVTTDYIREPHTKDSFKQYILHT